MANFGYAHYLASGVDNFLKPNAGKGLESFPHMWIISKKPIILASINLRYLAFCKENLNQALNLSDKSTQKCHGRASWLHYVAAALSPLWH